LLKGCLSLIHITAAVPVESDPMQKRPLGREA
jgi:hypothetical protein